MLRHSISICPSIPNIEFVYIAIVKTLQFIDDQVSRVIFSTIMASSSFELPSSWEAFWFKCRSACQRAPTDHLRWPTWPEMPHGPVPKVQDLRPSWCDLVWNIIEDLKISQKSCQVWAPMVLGHSSFLLPKGASVISGPWGAWQREISWEGGGKVWRSPNARACLSVHCASMCASLYKCKYKCILYSVCVRACTYIHIIMYSCVYRYN